MKQLAIKLATKAWTMPSTSNKEMDEVLCSEFIKILEEILSMPQLGNATTKDLLDEISARCEVNGTLSYKTTEE